MCMPGLLGVLLATVSVHSFDIVDSGPSNRMKTAEKWDGHGSSGIAEEKGRVGEMNPSGSRTLKIKENVDGREDGNWSKAGS